MAASYSTSPNDAPASGDASPPRVEGGCCSTVLAASSLDDPHSLDRGSPVSTGILRPLGHELPDSAEAWRLAWEEHGVDCDPVSSRVLVLNLRMRGDAACARLTEAACPEPLWLTWRSLNGTFRTDNADVFVCENPSVLIAAADTLGEHARPLVCTNGRPSAAATRLLAGLAAAGATLHVRADDDAAGQEIVSGLQSAIPGVRLWRFALRSPERPRYEEQDIHELLRDLDRSWTRPSDATLPLVAGDAPTVMVTSADIDAALEADDVQGLLTCDGSMSLASRRRTAATSSRSLAHHGDGERRPSGGVVRPFSAALKAAKTSLGSSSSS